MGEAGLERGGGRQGDRAPPRALHATRRAGHDRIVTIIEAALLATVALLAAWSGFAAAKWSTESRLQIAEASASRTEANRAFDEAAENKELDNLAFNAWFAPAMLAERAGDGDRRSVASVPSSTSRSTRGSRPTRSTTPTLPPGPTSMPEYEQPELAEAAELDQQRRGARRGGRGVGRDRGPLRAHHGVPRDRALPRRHQRSLHAARRPLRPDRHRDRHPHRRGGAARHLALATGLTPCLRAYIARSARSSSVSSSSSGSAAATPTLTPMRQRHAVRWHRAPRRRSGCARPPRPRHPGHCCSPHSTTNSSPPTRAIRSPRRTTDVSARATVTSAAVAGRVAELIVDRLEPVEIAEEQRRRSRTTITASRGRGASRRELRAVGETRSADRDGRAARGVPPHVGAPRSGTSRSPAVRTSDALPSSHAIASAG